MNFVVVYISPAGTTRHAAQVICDELSALGKACSVFDLGSKTCRAELANTLAAAASDACLFIGSPVYATHTVPAVMDFITNLPDGVACCSVPFVTWGAVTSGMALAEMAEALDAKGYPVMAAAKIVAEHSLLWQSESPLGKGRPDAADDRCVRSMVQKVAAALDRGSAKHLPTAGIELSARAPCRKSWRVWRCMLLKRFCRRLACSVSCAPCAGTVWQPVRSRLSSLSTVRYLKSAVLHVIIACEPVPGTGPAG